MLEKLGVGLVLSCLLGCGTYATQLITPDSAVYPDGMLSTSVGETHLLQAYVTRWGGVSDSQSFDCGDTASIVSSDPSIVTIGEMAREDVDTQTADTVSAFTALYHSVGVGRATIIATCGTITTELDVMVKP